MNPFAVNVSPRRLAACCAMALLLTANRESLADPPSSRELQVKAAFLFNFAQFVDWPASAFPESKSPLVIGILGNDPFGPTLDDFVRGEKVDGHPLTVQRYERIEEVKNCHILFVNETDDKRLEAVLSHLRGRSVLTVGDAPGFIKHGGIIRFISDSGKLRFQVSLSAAKMAGLSISSKLLRAAELVTTE